MKLAAVSVDLDEIPNYFGIHGLTADAATRTLVYDRAVPRLLDLVRSLGIPLTLFAVGEDLARAASAKALRDASDLGHEVANHTRHHRYDLVRLSPDEMRIQVEGGAEDIARATGRRPRGFRAPGYTVTDRLMDVLVEVGVSYDSSVFPCPAYWLAKASAVGLIRMRGRESKSIVDTPRMLTAPTDPYRVGRPYYTRGNGLLELPILVTRRLRLPVIGTSVTVAGPWGAGRLASACVGAPLLDLELHGIDVLDSSDGLEALAPYQLDVRVPVARKLAALESVVSVWKRAGYTFVTLEEAAEAFA